MSPSNGASESSQRVCELEKQLDDEKCAHRKTNSALRDIQDKLERMTAKVHFLGDDNNNDLQALAAENGELKNALNDLEMVNRTIRFENAEQSSTTVLTGELIKMKREMENQQEEMRIMRRILKEKMDKIEDLNTEVCHLVEDKRTLMETLESEKGKWKVELEQQQAEEVVVSEKSNNEALESLKVLEAERDEMKIRLERQSEKLKDFVARLEVYEAGDTLASWEWKHEKISII